MGCEETLPQWLKMLLSLSIRFSGTDREIWSLNSAIWSTTCCVQLSCYAYVPTFTSTMWDGTKSPTPYRRNTRNCTVVGEGVRPCRSFSTMKRATLSFLQPCAVVIRAKSASAGLRSGPTVFSMWIYAYSVAQRMCMQMFCIPSAVYFSCIAIYANIIARLFLTISHGSMLQKTFYICIIIIIICWI